jgi:pyruvate/2-oxoglutarate dehydrogenase complex dihydrolipoamide dehydrogenase (E3) component
MPESAAAASTGSASSSAAAAAGAGAPAAAAPFPVEPLDEHNRALLANVHPPGWTNPRPAARYHLVVVGGGTAGLVSAAGAAGLGARVALVERHLLGGDCLNVGCVPSKGVLRAARAWTDARQAAGRFGGPAAAGAPSFGAAMERMRRLRAAISPHDGAERFRGLGIDVFLGDATFTGPGEVEVDGRRLRFRRAVIAAGARAAVPPVPGLAETGFRTNETIFNLTELPRRLAVLGGGPIGCELAQAFARFGSEVTLLGRAQHVLPREDADAAAIVAAAMARDGVRIELGVEPVAARRRGAAKVLELRAARRGRKGEEARADQPSGASGAGASSAGADGRDAGGAEAGGGDASRAGVHPGGSRELEVDEILVATGRQPNVEGLGLEAAGVVYGRKGVEVDDRLRTSNPRIFACGDVASKHQFTHVADAQARLVIQNALFFGRAKASALTIPWCTYTSPEIAHVGLYEREARDRGLEVETLTLPLADNDRAVLDGEEEGFLRVHAQRGSGKLLGATLVAEHAGDMLGELCLAVTLGIGLGTIAGVIHPYPTQAEVVKKAADTWRRGKLTPTAQKLFAWWFRIFS